MRRVKTPTNQATTAASNGKGTESYGGGEIRKLWIHKNLDGGRCILRAIRLRGDVEAGPAVGKTGFRRPPEASSSRIHAVDGKGSDVLGTLPVMLEIDGDAGDGTTSEL